MALHDAERQAVMINRGLYGEQANIFHAVRTTTMMLLLLPARLTTNAGHSLTRDRQLGCRPGRRCSMTHKASSSPASGRRSLHVRWPRKIIITTPLTTTTMKTTTRLQRGEEGSTAARLAEFSVTTDKRSRLVDGCRWKERTRSSRLRRRMGATSESALNI